MKLLLLFLALAGAVHAATPATREIELLLAYVGGLDSATFIRNGGEHTAAEAQAHPRMKWEKQADQVKSAEDFIALCASRSSLSGARYEIRRKDGTKVYADDLLRAELARLRTPKK